MFDERVFPFASLRPNVDARLKAKLNLLPDILFNPSSSFGDANLHDHHLVSPVPANVLSSPVRGIVPAS